MQTQMNDPQSNTMENTNIKNLEKEKDVPKVKPNVSVNQSAQQKKDNINKTENAQTNKIKEVKPEGRILVENPGQIKKAENVNVKSEQKEQVKKVSTTSDKTKVQENEEKVNAIPIKPVVKPAPPIIAPTEKPLEKAKNIAAKPSPVSSAKSSLENVNIKRVNEASKPVVNKNKPDQKIQEVKIAPKKVNSANDLAENKKENEGAKIVSAKKSVQAQEKILIKKEPIQNEGKVKDVKSTVTANAEKGTGKAQINKTEKTPEIIQNLNLDKKVNKKVEVIPVKEVNKVDYKQEPVPGPSRVQVEKPNMSEKAKKDGIQLKEKPSQIIKEQLAQKTLQITNNEEVEKAEENKKETEKLQDGAVEIKFGLCPYPSPELNEDHAKDNATNENKESALEKKTGFVMDEKNETQNRSLMRILTEKSLLAEIVLGKVQQQRDGILESIRRKRAMVENFYQLMFEENENGKKELGFSSWIRSKTSKGNQDKEIAQDKSVLTLKQNQSVSEDNLKSASGEEDLASKSRFVRLKTNLKNNLRFKIPLIYNMVEHSDSTSEIKPEVKCGSYPGKKMTSDELLNYVKAKTEPLKESIKKSFDKHVLKKNPEEETVQKPDRTSYLKNDPPKMSDNKNEDKA